MASDKMKEIIERLKKQPSQTSQPKVEAKSEESEGTEEDLIEEDEGPKKEIKEAKMSDEEIKVKAINERIRELQNEGIFRLNLLIELNELNDTIKILTATIMKIGGIENQTDK